MTPEEFKQQTQTTYQKAMKNKNQHMDCPDVNLILFGQIYVYGRDAGSDFARSHVDKIYNAISTAAQAKKPSLVLHPSRFGHAALEGMANALQELTFMEVTSNNSTVTITWAKQTISLV